MSNFTRAFTFAIGSLLGLASVEITSLYADDSVSAVREEQEALIPKRETGVLDFLERHPEYDGRGVVIAVFDTGVDPAAKGLQTTTKGERKIVDVIDASGSGDVDTSHTAEADQEGTLQGLTGRTLQLPDKIKNPSGKFHLGIKDGDHLFNKWTGERIEKLRSEKWQRELAEIRTRRAQKKAAAEKKGKRAAFSKASADLTLKEKDLIAREKQLEELEKNADDDDPGPVYDCVLWSDGTDFHVIVDTDEDGDLGEETVLRPFGIAGEYAGFGDEEASNFAVQVYADGDLLSIVTVSGSHGSHVASIAAGNFPDSPHRNGIAPGAQILSVKIGDIRMGGSSNGVGGLRGVAACSQYGVDIMNASWGGASDYQDGSNFSSQIYNLLVEKYGVTAFVSAGNSGPALSTLGAPGGEASSVIGVGAYVSSEMGRVLYSQTVESPSTAYQFSARGPAKNGDLGVDVTGPGGAFASLAYDSLSGSERYNGTSMSAPSVAGLGALLVSAAKQENLKHSPARIRAALMNSAQRVRTSDIWAQGAGLVRALPAWRHLKANAGSPAWDHFYTVETEDNTFSDGPGLYLRGNIPAGERSVRFDISPKFLHRIASEEKFDLEDDLQFTATEPWVQVPDYARMVNGSITLRPILDIPEARHGHAVHYAEIHASLASSPKAGPLLRIPITIVQGAETDPHSQQRAEFPAKLRSGEIERRFFQVPADTNFARVRLRRDAQDAVRRTFVLHAVSLVADRSYYAYNSHEYLTLEADAEKEVMVPVAAGKTLELALLQPWFTAGESSLQVEVKFLGVRAKQDLVNFREGDKFAPLEVVAGSDVEVKGEGSIGRAHFAAMPEKTEFLAPDKRDQQAPGPRQEENFSPPFLRQTFQISVEKPTKIKLRSAYQFPIDFQVAGGLLTFYHESGKLLFQGSTSRASEFELPKGETTVYRELRHFDRKILEQEKDRPLRYSHKLEKAKTLALYESPPAALRGAKADEVELKRGRNTSLIVGASGLGELSALKPQPDYFSGEFRLMQDKETHLLKIQVECHPGANFKTVANQKKKPESLEKKKPVLDKLDEDLFQRRLAFVKATRFSAKENEQSKRDELLAKLLEERPKDAELHVMQASILAGRHGLLSDWHQATKPKEKPDSRNKGEEEKSDKKPKAMAGAKEKDKAKAEEKAAAKTPEPADKKTLKKIAATLKKARALSGPKNVAAYFGAQAESDNRSLEERKADEAKKKEMEKRRKRLAQIALLQADVLLHSDKLDAARAAMRECRRWQDEPSKEYQKQEVALLRAEELYGLALQKLDEQLEDAPFDEKLIKQKIELYEKLGWDERWVERIRLRSQMRKHRVALPQ